MHSGPVEVLENRLDKAMIKYNEAQSIRKTYEQIVRGEGPLQRKGCGRRARAGAGDRLAPAWQDCLVSSTMILGRAGEWCGPVALGPAAGLVG